MKKQTPHHQPPLHRPNGNHMNVPLGDKEMTTYHMCDLRGNSEMENWILPAFFHSILTYSIYSS